MPECGYIFVERPEKIGTKERLTRSLVGLVQSGVGCDYSGSNRRLTAVSYLRSKKECPVKLWLE